MRGMIIVISLMLLAGCKKPADRRCLKGTGELTSVEIELDSVNSFELYKNMNFVFYQDSFRKIVVKGGENMVNHIEIIQDNGIVSIQNRSTCNFLRNQSSDVTIEIHYPYFKNIYAEVTDSLRFADQIVSDSLFIMLRNGGGYSYLNLSTDFLRVNNSYGTGNYVLVGNANRAEVKVQNNGYADATGFIAPSMFVYSNSTADLKVNLEGCSALVKVEGTGNIRYLGAPFSVVLENPGDGEFLPL